MSFLDNLTDTQRDVLVSLPYRAGLWVSLSDTSGGDEADMRERQVLSDLIEGFAEQVFGSETVQYIISETLKRRGDWPRWADNISGVPEDCRIAVDVLREHVDEKDVTTFRNHLMEIGEAVAMAFREEKHIFEKMYLFGYFMRSSLRPRVKGRRRKSYPELLSVSLNELRALERLARALGVAYS